MTIIAAYQDAGTYRGAAAICRPPGEQSATRQMRGAPPVLGAARCD